MLVNVNEDGGYIFVGNRAVYILIQGPWKRTRTSSFGLCKFPTKPWLLYQGFGNCSGLLRVPRVLFGLVVITQAFLKRSPSSFGHQSLLVTSGLVLLRRNQPNWAKKGHKVPAAVWLRLYYTCIHGSNDVYSIFRVYSSCINSIYRGVGPSYSIFGVVGRFSTNYFGLGARGWSQGAPIGSNSAILHNTSFLRPLLVIKWYVYRYNIYITHMYHIYITEQRDLKKSCHRWVST